MEIQVIINELKGENDLILFDPMTGETKEPEQLNDTNKFFYNAHIEAAKALEKLVRKKVIGQKANLLIRMCPTCNEWMAFETRRYPYCPNCGQALDWSD